MAFRTFLVSLSIYKYYPFAFTARTCHPCQRMPSCPMAIVALYQFILKYCNTHPPPASAYLALGARVQQSKWVHSFTPAKCTSNLSFFGMFFQQYLLINLFIAVIASCRICLCEILPFMPLVSTSIHISLNTLSL